MSISPTPKLFQSTKIEETRKPEHIQPSIQLLMLFYEYHYVVTFHSCFGTFGYFLESVRSSVYLRNAVRECSSHLAQTST